MICIEIVNFNFLVFLGFFSIFLISEYLKTDIKLAEYPRYSKFGIAIGFLVPHKNVWILIIMKI